MARSKSIRIKELDEQILMAIEALKKKEFKTPYAASKHFKVSYSTLYRRMQGGLSVSESREPQQILSAAEEAAIVNWICHSGAMGFPPTHSLIREIADELRKRRLFNINDQNIQLVTYEPIGQEWVLRFLKRHPELETVMSKTIEKARTEITREQVENWFKELKEIIEEYKILPENMYNLDETGSSMGTIEEGYIVVDKESQMKRYKAEPGRQEWITVLECICADGTSIAPMIIFKGKNVNSGWIPENVPDNWKFAANTKGWTNNSFAVQWLQQDFELETKEKANGQTRLLI